MMADVAANTDAAELVLCQTAAALQTIQRYLTAENLELEHVGRPVKFGRHYEVPAAGYVVPQERRDA